MNSEVKIEINKFLVVKRSWINENLSDKVIALLRGLIDKAIKDKSDHSYYVVNVDEPYAEEVRNLIYQNELKKIKKEKI